MAVKRTTAATPPPVPMTVSAKAKSVGKLPDKTPAKASTPVASAKQSLIDKSPLVSKTPVKAGVQSVAKPVTKSPPAAAVKTPSTATAQTVKVSRPLAANQAVVTRNARAPAAKAVTKPVLAFAERLSLVAETAYYLSENRGFLPGYDLADWLEAEQRVDARFHFT